MEKKKPGPPKRGAWKDDYELDYNRRLREGRSLESFDDECKELVRLHGSKKTRPAGDSDEKPLTYKRLRERMRERGINAKIYKADRKKNIDKLVRASRAFLNAYES